MAENSGITTQNEVETREALLRKLEKFLHKNARKRGGISDETEMRMWLVDSVANLPSSSNKRLSELANHKIEDEEKDFIRQLLLLTCQNQPKEAAKVLIEEGRIFQRFFRDDDDRAAKWFQHFKFSGDNEYGAVALERYLFDARSDLWEKLKWTGKRDVTPCVAVQKHRHAVDLLVHEEEAFWVSSAFREGLISGDFLSVDYIFEEKLEGQDRGVVKNLIHTYIEKESQKELAQQLSRFFSDKELLGLVYHSMPSNSKFTFVEYIVSECKWKTIEDLLLYHALATHTHTLVSRIIKDEDGKDYADMMDSILKEAEGEEGEGPQQQAAMHSHLSSLDSHKDSQVCVLWSRFICLESFLLFFRLVRFHTKERSLMEQAFDSLGVEYEPLFMEDDGIEADTGDKKRKLKNDKKEKRKKQRNSKSHSSESLSSLLVGWKLSSPDIKSTESVTYGILEAPQFLYGLFVQRLFNSVIM